MNFLPAGYQAPKSNNGYMKLQDGENKFRILSQPILGWEDWLDKKPVRYRFDEKPRCSVDPKKPVKHFWAMIVWNYIEEEIQILHITQASIRKSLEALCSDQDWGAPYFYDLKIVKSGDGMETEYTVNPIPHKPLASHVEQKFNEKRCNLEALFNGDDPFGKHHSSYTDGIFTQGVIQDIKGTITEDQAEELSALLKQCDDSFKDKVYDFIKGKGVTEISMLPVILYPDLKKRIEKEITLNEVPF